MPPSRFTISRKALRRGNWLAGLGAALALLPVWTVGLLLGEEPGDGLLLVTLIPGFALIFAAVFVVRKALRCPRCEGRWGRDVIPHRVMSQGGSFYCPRCGAEIMIE